MKFLKNNLFYFISIALSIGLLMLGFLSRYFVASSLALLSVTSIFATIRVHKRYKSLEDYHVSDDYFDATKLDYDEDVYFIGDTDEKRQEIKGKLGQFSALMPTIIFGFLSIAFAIMTFYAIFKF